MTNDKPDTTIQDRIKALPPIIQQAIASIDFGKEINAIQKKYFLSLDKIADLEIETMLIMLGLDEPENFTKNLMENLGLEKNISLSIQEDLNESIFKKVKSAIVKASEDKKDNTKTTIQTNVAKEEDKESILKEIENPTPTFSNVVKVNTPIPQLQVANSTPAIVTGEVAHTVAPQGDTIGVKQEANMVEQKLSTPVRSPSEKIDISSDPYLEKF